MSQPGPIIGVSDEEDATFARNLTDSRLFPLVETSWNDAQEAIERVRPSAVIVSGRYEPHALEALAHQYERFQPYAALIIIEPIGPLPLNALPFTENDSPRFSARLNAALRVRTLHATVLRSIHDLPLSKFQF